MASARNAALPPLPPHLRSSRVGDLLPWPIPRPTPDHPTKRSPEVEGPTRGTAVPVRSADDEAFVRIYRDETPGLVRFFRRRLGHADEADDLAHETMVRFIRAAPSTLIAAPQAYLRRIATNLLRDRAERGSTRIAAASVPLEEALHAPADDDPHRTVEGREEWNRWAVILRDLPSRTLDVFLLSRVDGFTYQEIAEHLDTNVWSVKRHMMKAIAHLDQNRSGAP